MNQLTFHNMTITWLASTNSVTDGGPVFGAVPAAVWTSKYPHNPATLQIEKVNDPILVQFEGRNFLIDAGYDTSKFPAKKYRNTGVQNESTLEASLAALDLTPIDIDTILMTHMHDDHAGGLTKKINDDYISVFPNATIYMTTIEWDEVRQPNNRTKRTYLKENWQPIEKQVKLFSDFIEISPGIEMHHTGGHSNGLAIIKLIQEEDVILHLSDLMQTTATSNPLWVSAYDDYPMDTIKAREKWQREAIDNNYQFIFFHDSYYCMVQYDTTGQKIVNSLKREKKFEFDPEIFYKNNEK